MTSRNRVELASRVLEIRRELFGEHGGPLLAERLGLSHRAWAQFEAGRAIPAITVLRLIELTRVNIHWLSTGRGNKYLDRPEAGGLRVRGDPGEN